MMAVSIEVFVLKISLQRVRHIYGVSLVANQIGGWPDSNCPRPVRLLFWVVYPITHWSGQSVRDALDGVPPGCDRNDS